MPREFFTTLTNFRLFLLDTPVRISYNKIRKKYPLPCPEKEVMFMKRSRILVFVLICVLAVSLLPVIALAAGTNPWYAYVDGVAYDSANAKLGDWDKISAVLFREELENTGTSATISIKDYQKLMTGSDGAVYELMGIHAMTGTAWDSAEKTAIANGTSAVTVTPAPDPADYATEEAYQAAYAKWEQDSTNYVILAYGPHAHAYSGWQTSVTNHWRYCYACGENFLKMDWHSDKDRDDKCDVCGMDIVYYSITVAETTGGQVVEMEGDIDGTAPYNRTIVIAVKPDDGYVVKDVRFYKVRGDGSRSELTRKIIVPGVDYSFVMPNFDVEIVATFAET